MRIKKTIKEKCLSVLIVMCMVLGLMQTEWGIVNVKAAGKSVSSEGDFGSVVSYTYSKQTTAESTFDVISLTAGEYVLTRDVTISHPLYIANGVEVTIILDGHTLSRGLTDKAATKDGLVIVCEGDLTLGSENNREGVITGGNCNGISLPGGIYVGMKQKSSRLINYVTISGNNGASGGGVYACGNEGEVLVENYGYITNNTTRASGGGIYAYSYRSGGSVELYNYGYIEENAATSSGGGLYVWADNGTIYFENNKNIDNNTAETQGGGVYITGSECTFYNKGSIIGNKTENSLGGGVRVYSGTFKNSGKIKNNIAKNGAAIYNASSATNKGVWLLDGTEITDNEATKFGGGISGDGKLYMSGKVIVDGNYGNTASSRKSDNIRLIRNKPLYIIGALSNGSSIGINVSSDETSSSSYYASVISSDYGQYVSENELKYFTLDNVYSANHIMFVNTSGEVEIGTHTHSWGYANGDTSNTIKAYCTAQFPSCEYYGTSTDANKYLTLTLNASNIEYSGIIYSGASAQWDTASVNNEVFTIYYEGTQSTAYSKTTSRPTEAGTYKATVTLGSAVASAEFEISKINQSSGLTITMSDYVYNQSEALPTPSINGTISGGATVKYYYNTSNSNSGGAEWKDIDSTSLPDGTYYMYAVVEATNNYNEYVTETVPFDVLATDMTGITVENVDVTYDGEYHGIDITGVLQGATIKYGTSEGTYTLDECPTYKDANTEAYVIYYQVTLPGYNRYTGSATVKINPVVVDIIWGETTFVYDGQAHAPQADVTGIITGDTCSVTVNGEETNAGTGYQAEADVDNSNYKINEAHKYVTFEITKAMQNAPQVEGVDETVLGKADGKISGLITSMEYRTENSSEYEAITSEDMTFEPGKYYVRYAEASNYNSSEETEVVIGEGEALTVSLPTEQVGYNISVDKQTLIWQEGYEVTFALAEGYRKTDEFVIKINDMPISLSDDNKYAASLVECDQVITVTGVEEIIPPVALGLVDGKTYCHDVEFEVEEGSSYKVYVDGYEVELRDGKYTISVGSIDVDPEVSDYETHVIRIVEGEDNVTEYTIIVTSNHEYEEPEFSWSEDNSSVTATSKCIHDDEHVVTVTEDTAMDIIQQATETEDGKVEYTVTVVIDGVEYTSKKIVEKSIDDEVFKDNEPSKDNEASKDDDTSKGNESSKDDDTSKGNESSKDDDTSKGNESSKDDAISKDDDTSKDNGASKDNQSSTGNGQGVVPGLGDTNPIELFIMYALLMAMVVCVCRLKVRNKETE